jgi:hypothetical protein
MLHFLSHSTKVNSRVRRDFLRLHNVGFTTLIILQSLALASERPYFATLSRARLEGKKYAPRSPKVTEEAWVTTAFSEQHTPDNQADGSVAGSSR